MKKVNRRIFIKNMAPAAVASTASPGLAGQLLTAETRTGAVSKMASGAYDVVAEGSCVMIDGLAYQKMDSAHPLYGTDPIPDMPAYAPAGDAWLTHWGPKSDGTTDDAIKVSAWISYCHGAEARGYAPPGRYAISYVYDRSVSSNLHIECHKDAKFIGTPTKETVASNGTLTTHTVTSFTAGKNGFHVVYVSEGTETTWTEGKEYIVRGQTVYWNKGASPHGALASSGTLRITSADSMIELGPKKAYAQSLRWIGGTIDNSARGFAPTRASGTGMTIVRFKSYLVEGVKYYGSDDYEISRTAGVSDSGISISSCDHGEVKGCHFVGQADLGLYITGGGSTGEADDTFIHDVHGNYFEACGGGGKGSRQARATFCHSNTFYRCYAGFNIDGVASGGTLIGASGHIHNNTFLKIVKRAINARRADNVLVTNNIIVDFGEEINNGNEVSGGGVAIEFGGVSGGRISGNIIKLNSFAPGASKGVDIHDDNTGTTIETTNITVEGNHIEGVNTGIAERNKGTGNIFRENNILNTNVSIDLPPGRRWNYRSSNISVDGVGSKKFHGTFTPKFHFLSASGGATFIPFGAPSGSYYRHGDICEVSLSASYTIIHSETSKIFTITGLPYKANKGKNYCAVGSARIISNVTYPNNGTIPSPFILEGRDRIELNLLSPDTTEDAILTSDYITTGSTVRIDMSIIYRVEPELQN